MQDQKANPTVSVIVAVYNLENCIEKSLDTILNQTFDDFEIVVFEDASKDRSRSILQKMAEADPRIRIILTDTNMGQAYGRNQCMAQAKGKYLAIHDGDDYSVPERLEKQVAFLENHLEYDFVASWGDLIDEKGTIISLSGGVQGDMKKEDFLWGMPVFHGTCMFKKSAIEAVGGFRVDQQTRFRGEDYDMLMRMYVKGFRCFVLPERLYIYAENSDAWKRRKYRYRFSEFKMRWHNFKELGLMPKGIPYVIKPMIVGLLPQNFLHKIRMASRKKS